MPEAAAGAPLSGVRVLDFTTAMAGPTASMLLGDFGAAVVKVEPPEGESSRRWGIARFGAAGEVTGLFAALNRNKASDHRRSEVARRARRRSRARG